MTIATLATVRIPTPLRRFTGGADEVPTSGETVAEVLRNLVGEHEGLDRHILDADGSVRRFVNVFVGSRNMSSLEGLATPVSAGDVLTIVPAVAGGTGRAIERTGSGGASCGGRRP